MENFLIKGMKWACLSCCSLILWGNMENVTVSASDMYYDETDEIQEVQNNGSGIGLKDIQGWGKNTEENSENVGEMIENPYGVYYTTPRCEAMDIYSGERCNDTLLFQICKNQNTDNSATIIINPAINDDLEDTVQVKFDSEKEIWEGAGNTQLWYDDYLGKYIFSNDKISVCLEDITMESASLYDRSHRSDDIPFEGEFVSETGMNNGLKVYINEIFNTEYYHISIETYDGTIATTGVKMMDGEYSDCTTTIGESGYYIYGEDKDENGIANALHMFTLYLDGNDVDYYLYRSNDDFDATLNQDIYSGTYTIEELNTIINIQYDEESEAFYYDISVDGQTLETSSNVAVCTGPLGYQVMSTDFIIDYANYIMDGDDIFIAIPGISPYSYSCTFEASENSKNVNYYAAYQYVLEDAYENYGESCKYALYDLDNDGVKELILSEGTCNADWTNDVYCVNEYGFALGIGSFARPVVLYEAPDGNGIYVVWGNRGLEEVTRITKNGSELEEELILSDSISYDEDYVTYPNEITTAYVDDYSLLEG